MNTTQEKQMDEFCSGMGECYAACVEGCITRVAAKEGIGIEDVLGRMKRVVVNHGDDIYLDDVKIFRVETFFEGSTFGVRTTWFGGKYYK